MLKFELGSRTSPVHVWTEAELGRLTGRPPKSLMRMLGPKGNPQARNLFEVIGELQRIEGLHFEVSLRAAS